MFSWFVFVYLVKWQRCLNACFFFPVFWAFVLRLLLVYLGLEGFGVFVFLVLFLFYLGLVFVYFALFLFCCWIIFGVVRVSVFGGCSVFFS